MKQTAVQWYAERLYDLEMAYNQGVIKTNTYIKGKREAIEQAKEIEKERLAETWIAALEYRTTNLKGLNNLTSEEAFEKYYNETYGDNK